MRFTFAFILSVITLSIFGQELNAKVVIDDTQVTISDPSVFDDMKTDFAEFLSNRKWTDDTYMPHERINCNILMTITSVPSVGTYEASVQIVSSRPVFGTDYETVLLNFADRDWVFSYIPSRPMQYNENSFTDNITSLLAYYAYIILGLDYDSFGDLAGAKYFQRAQQIVNNAQQSNYPGWTQFGSNRNRFWLIENLQNPSLEPIRNAMYKYHRQGLDIMRDSPDEAKAKIAEGLQDIQKANRTRPRSVLVNSFMDAKSTELANIFATGNSTVRKKAYAILIQIEPTKTTMFKSMVE